MFNHYYIQFVPISGFNGDNTVEWSKNMPWHNDPTLLEALDNVKVLSGLLRSLCVFRCRVSTRSWASGLSLFGVLRRAT